MKGFWTCGPFKEAEDRHQRRIFKMEQMEMFMNILKSLEKLDKQIEEAESTEDRYLGMLMKQDVEKDLDIILGIDNERQDKNKEILGEALLESLTARTEK